jgi:hypothetical protein
LSSEEFTLQREMRFTSSLNFPGHVRHKSEGCDNLGLTTIRGRQCEQISKWLLLVAFFVG